MSTEQENFDEEQVYDEKIAPLMAQIIAVCKAHKIPFIASFNYANRKDDPDGPAYCTSMINPEGRLSKELDEMKQVLYRPAGFALLITGPKQ